MSDVASAPEGYVAAYGTLTFDTARLPETDWQAQENTPPVTRIPARLSGSSLTQNGFTGPLNSALTMEVACFGPWCASAPSGQMVLAFLKQSPKGQSLKLTPCGSHLVFDPALSDLRATKRCYLEGACGTP